MPLPDVLAEFAATTISDSFDVTLSRASTPGRTLFATVACEAIVTPPAGWLKDELNLASRDDSLMRLPKASHTAPISQVTFGLSVARGISIVIYEDDVTDDDVGIFFPNIGISSPTQWGTGAWTVPQSDVALAVYMAQVQAPGAYDQVQFVSFDQGFVAVADTTESVAGTFASVRHWVAGGVDVAFVSDGVVATTIDNNGTSPVSGLLSYNQDAAPDVPPSTPATFTATPSDSTVTLDWSTSTGTPEPTYSLRRRVDGGAWADLVSGLSALTYDDTTVVNDTSYEYELTAVNREGTSTPVTAGPVTPTAPVEPEPEGEWPTLDDLRRLVGAPSTADDPSLITSLDAAIQWVGDRVYATSVGSDDVDYAVLLLAARLYQRRRSPEGVSGIGGDGLAIRVIANDPDIRQLLERHHDFTDIGLG